ncbi:sensor histidine kinase [Edaphocola aurantiacus]|uniref:sensor histidine kinase n=1 Tax=Edaphocola aurantiacus TaxID=2601682 RepID=UPI001C95924D|nr:histidine kinase [Edaphocola aurantiacus]
MTNKKNTFLSNNRKRLLFTVSAFLLLYLVAYILDPFSAQWYGFFERSPLRMFRELGTSLVICLAISESAITISNILNKYIQWTSRPLTRLILETGLNLVLVLIINLLVSAWCLYGDPEIANYVPSPEEQRGFIQWVIVSIIISFMIMGINIGNYLISNWKNEVIRVSELNQLATESELQSLKLQLDPHFVFNNLSVLSELILEDQQLGYAYAENFSKIYRYMLVNAKKDLIPLEEELKFLDSYMFLIENRFGSGVHFNINVQPEAKAMGMPPLTIQMLVENALKHNRTNKKEPLTIDIYDQEGTALIVANNLLPIERTIDSSGIGLRNILRRYHLLSQQEPKIAADQQSFKVIVPLIKI